ncbi:MAG: type III effector [Gammaproteobacteria bacterium]|nr:MAG: type III effector [Gammaproteobacteria bacterium]
MQLNEFLASLNKTEENIDFATTMATIDDNYLFSPTSFNNGDCVNESNTNNGSCKIFAFGLLNKLTEQQTLACFGDYYRQDVLGNPKGDDHQNIRNFMSTGWAGIKFNGEALTRT